MTGTIQTETQTNITSVGTLSSLAVSGNQTVGEIFAVTSSQQQVIQQLVQVLSAMRNVFIHSSAPQVVLITVGDIWITYHSTLYNE